ncbi:MAG TPA: SH3 domain-containing protein [Stellaceae bacterium]|nr:SH3 domain-containing protein [Stellaceae bacterium]
MALGLGACAVLVSLASCDTAQSILDSNDVCRDQRAALRSYGDYFAQDILIGGGIGAAAGAIVGAATHQSVGTTLGLTAAGFAVGAGAGYWAAVEQKNSDTAARQRQVLTDIDADNKKIDGAQAAFNDLVKCRNQEAARLRADVNAGRISQTDGGKQMADIRSRYDDDIALGKKVGANIATHSADLEFANEQLKPQPYVTLHSAPVYATQDQKSARLENLRSGAVIDGAAIDTTWVKVRLSRGRTGYMLASDLELQAQMIVANRARRHSPPPSAKGDPVAEGCFTNLSKRADFDDSVQTASANTSGFELSGS